MSESTALAAREDLFKNRNFRWLISSGFISMLGDQFSLLAMPWLVLKMTGDTMLLGAVLAVISVPRALFLLIGGAMVDRHSPKLVLMLTKYINLILLGLLGTLVLLGTLQIWMVFIMAFAFGLSTAFSIPSSMAMMPHVIKQDQLQAANSVMMGLQQATMVVGPLLAGLLIAGFGDSGGGANGTTADARGLGFAFLFDACSFALSAWALSRVLPHTEPLAAPPASAEVAAQSTLAAVAEGLRFCWHDRDMRACFIYWTAVMFFVTGPVQVAMPVLANQLGNSAATFGILVGMHGAGTLLGMLVAGIKPNFRIGSFGSTMLLLDCIVGTLFIAMSRVSVTWQGALLLMTIGLFSGFLQIVVYTWMQRRVTPDIIGRVMSLFMFIVVVVAPTSAALTGVLMRSVTPAMLFIGSGSLMVAIVLMALMTSSLCSVQDVAPASEVKH